MINKTVVAILFLFAPQWAFSVDLKTDYDTFYQRSGQAGNLELKANQEISLQDGEQVLLQSENRVPLLIYIPSKTKSKLTVSNAEQEELVQKYTQKRIEKSVSEIVSELTSIERSIQKKNYVEARTNVLRLKEKYPEVPSILFMSGTIHFLMNNKNASIADLENGLAINPNNEDAKRLLARLKREHD